MHKKILKVENLQQGNACTNTKSLFVCVFEDEHKANSQGNRYVGIKENSPRLSHPPTTIFDEQSLLTGTSSAELRPPEGSYRILV